MSTVLWISQPTVRTSAIVEARLFGGPYDGVLVRMDPGEAARQNIYLPDPNWQNENTLMMIGDAEFVTPVITQLQTVRYLHVARPVCLPDFRLRYDFYR